MDREQVWDHTVAARETLAATLATLTPEQWDAPSLCDGWRVRDVAAHLIWGPQVYWWDTVKLMRHAWRGYNGMIAHTGRLRGSAPVEDILADYERYAALRHPPALVSHREALIDALVHSQDIVRPLGLTQEMPPDAAAVAAQRAWTLALAMGGRAREARKLRLVATDSDWSAGRGDRTLEGPTGELLMLVTGRDPDWAQLWGPVSEQREPA